MASCRPAALRTSAASAPGGFGWALLGLRVVVDLAPWLVAAGVHWNQVQDLAGDAFAGTVWGAWLSATYRHPLGDSDWAFLFAGEVTGGGGPVRLEDVESRLGEAYVLGLVHLGFGLHDRLDVVRHGQR